jgi:hypothetical protein
LPLSSHKWTWGEILSEGDVLALRRSGTRPQKAAHSWYDLSLKDGKLLGDDSSHSNLTSHGRYDDVPVEVSHPLPFSNATDIPFFTGHDHFQYNPLKISKDPSSESLETSDDRLPALAQPPAPAKISATAPTHNLFSQYIPENQGLPKYIWS